MRIVFLAKRRYTNKDTLRERFGRCYQLPWHWAQAGDDVSLELVDYRNGLPEQTTHDTLRVRSWPLTRLGTLLATLRAQPAQVIVASGDCFLGLLALQACRRTGARFVFDVYDDYRSFGAYRVFLGWDAYGYLLRRADHAFFASQALGARHPAAGPWTLVPNGIDDTLFKPMSQAAARAAIGIPHDKTPWVGYFGGLDAARGIEDLIAAVAHLRRARPTLRLLVAGQAPRGLRFAHDWIDFRGPVPHGDMPAYLNACDVLALPYRRAPGLDMASSCKIAEYLNCRRPLAATATPNLLANFPRQAHELEGRLARAGDVDDLARVIALQLDAPLLTTPPDDATWARIAARARAVLATAP